MFETSTVKSRRLSSLFESDPDLDPNAYSPLKTLVLWLLFIPFGMLLGVLMPILFPIAIIAAVVGTFSGGRKSATLAPGVIDVNDADPKSHSSLIDASESTTTGQLGDTARKSTARMRRRRRMK